MLSSDEEDEAGMLVHLPADITRELPTEPGYGLVPRRIAPVCGIQ